MKSVKVWLTSIFLIASCPVAGQLSVELDVNENGQLTGARYVLVDGNYYDMAFAVGSCVEVYSGCDESSDFPFDNYPDAASALMALEEQVLLDVAGVGDFDSDPTRSYTCEIAVPNPESQCYIALPHDSNGVSLPTIPVLINSSASLPQGDFVAGFPPINIGFGNVQIDSNVTFTWSVWTPSVLPDSDGDGVDDTVDNCIESPNADQRDTDQDGFGNRCDSDLNNDGLTNFLDIALFADVFGTQGDVDADFDGDGAVTFLDYAILTGFFGLPPGPGSATNQF